MITSSSSLETTGSLHVVNFKIYKISQDTHKLTRTTILIIKEQRQNHHLYSHYSATWIPPARFHQNQRSHFSDTSSCPPIEKFYGKWWPRAYFLVILFYFLFFLLIFFSPLPNIILNVLIKFTRKKLTTLK